MSFPSYRTTYGILNFNGKSYKIFNRPLSKNIENKIIEYKKSNINTFSTAPWSDSIYKWIIENDKLYLNHISFKFDKNGNSIKKIFNQNRIFANWVNGDIKILISVYDISNIDDSMTESEIYAMNNPAIAIVEREVKILSFSHGKLISIGDNFKERYRERRLIGYKPS